MYDFLTGRLVACGVDEVVLEAGGVGYALTVSGATLGRLPAAGTTTTLYVHDMLRDERWALFGFFSKEERRLFRQLLGVSKIGPSLALSLLSALEPGALSAAVESGDVSSLSRVKGVGRRTAERLCVELKGRLAPLGATLPGPLTDRTAAVSAALQALGYPQQPAQQAAERACTGAPGDAALEGLVKQALRFAGGARALSAD